MVEDWVKLVLCCSKNGILSRTYMKKQISYTFTPAFTTRRTLIQVKPDLQWTRSELENVVQFLLAATSGQQTSLFPQQRQLELQRRRIIRGNPP